MSEQSYEPERGGEKSWRAIAEVVRSKQGKRINAVVFRYISEQCSNNKEQTTSDAICAMEERLRHEDVNLWCVAHPIAPPNQLARSLAGEPCNYFLLLALSEADRDKFFKESDCTIAQNAANLKQTGFQSAPAHENSGIGAESTSTASNSTGSGGTGPTRKKTKADYLELPHDLQDEQREMHFDEAAIRFYDPLLNADLFRRHAKEVASNRATGEKKASRLFEGTGIQVVRTSVAPHKWAETRQSIIDQAHTLMPIADKDIIGCVREQVIPLGFQLHGTTSTPLYLGTADQPVYLFDLYCCTVRRYHIDVSQADADILTNQSTDAETLHETIARCAETVPEEIEHVTTDRLNRFVQFRVLDESN